MAIPVEALTSLLVNIAQTLHYNYKLITEVEKSIIDLSPQLHKLEGLMIDIINDYNHTDAPSTFLRRCGKEIKQVIGEVDDAVDTYVVEAALNKSRGRVSRASHPFEYYKKRKKMGERIREIKEEVDRLCVRAEAVFLSLTSDSKRRQKQPSITTEDPRVEEEDVIGFDEAIMQVSQYLQDGPEHLQVISIVGMFGLGKTTLTKKVFNSNVCDAYTIRVFVHISTKYQRREVFLRILRSLQVDSGTLKYSSDEELQTLIKEKLTDESYLIVLDDIWEIEDWDRLKNAFPKNNQRCRVLITTRHDKVARHVEGSSSGACVYKLEFLSTQNSSRLLRWKVFRNGVFPQNLKVYEDRLKVYEDRILFKCKGLPLAIVVIAGILSNSPGEMGWWKKVADGVNNITEEDGKQSTKLMELMYKHLPNQLKLCFLYLGLFPEDYEIPVWKLVRLWIAEGLVKMEGHSNMEDIAEDYLDDLVSRNMVTVQQRGSNGKIKTCSLHDTLRVFCKKEAAEENLFQEIKLDDMNRILLGSPVGQPHRRFCLGDVNISDLISLHKSGKNLRSLLTFTRKEEKIEPNVLETFKLLRVLEIQSLKFLGKPIELKSLILLKYVAISSNITRLPKTMSAMWNLQTLIVHTESPVLEIEINIWKLPQFRHLHTNTSTILPCPGFDNPKKKETDTIFQDIRTLSTIAPKCCTKEILVKNHKLKKLGICGKLDELFQVSGDSSLFSNVKALHSLEKLRLVNKDETAQLDRLPSDDNSFPPLLTKLTLSGSRLDWNEMQRLGKLENLEILKLKDEAFRGKNWQGKSGGFRRLKHLHIGKTDLEEWKASGSGDDFPQLQRLELFFCTKLKAVPDNFTVMSRLQLFLHDTNNDAASSASTLKAKYSNKDSKFKLSVYPLDHLS